MPIMRASAMTRLARLLRLGGTGQRDRSRAQTRLDRARAAAVSWKARAAELIARGEEQNARLAELQQLTLDLRARIASGRRETPSVDLARSIFAHRLRTLPARARIPPAPDRERRFADVSPTYRTAVDAGPATRSLATPIAVDGITWWVPPRTGTERLPFRGILQTREVASGGIMLDLGANIGRMAIPRVVFGDVAVAYCAEPDPLNFACLAATVIENGLRGLVLPDQTAIGDHNGTVRLLREGSSGNFHVLTGDAGFSVSRDVVDVPCCTLDTWVDRLGIDLDAVTFIKVDVEGFERRVVAGADRVLSHPHIAWQMEIKPAGLRGAGDEPAALYDDLQRRFTHFTDLNRHAHGPRVRPIAELAAALAYIEPVGKTDVVLFSADVPRSG
jgi:FkbM family methyltransferase